MKQKDDEKRREGWTHSLKTVWGGIKWRRQSSNGMPRESKAPDQSKRDNKSEKEKNQRKRSNLKTSLLPFLSGIESSKGWGQCFSCFSWFISFFRFMFSNKSKWCFQSMFPESDLLYNNNIDRIRDAWLLENHSFDSPEKTQIKRENNTIFLKIFQVWLDITLFMLNVM